MQRKRQHPEGRCIKIYPLESFISSYRYILLGIGASLFYLATDSLFHWALWGREGFFPDTYFMWRHLLPAAFILLGGLHLQVYVNRLRVQNRLLETRLALRDKEIKMQLILERTSLLMSIMDKDGRYLYSSPSHIASIGYTPDFLLGKSWFDFIHPDDKARLADLLTQALEGRIDSVGAVPYRMIDSQGKTQHLEGAFATVRDTLGNLKKIILVAENITEQREMASTLASSEQRLRAIADVIPVSLAEIDAQGCYQFINKRYSDIFGYTIDDLKTMSVKDLAVSEGEGKELLSLLKKLAEDQPPPFRWEGRNRTQSGRILDVTVDWNYVRNDRKEVTGFITAVTDVTEQKKTAAILKEKEARYRVIFNSPWICVAVYKPVDNGQNFVFLDLNETAQQLEQVSLDDIIGKTVTAAFPGVEEFGLLDVMRRVYQTGQPEHHPIRQYRDDRITGWRENYVYKLPNEEIVAVYTDETERIQAEKALAESEARFRSLVESSTDHIFLLDRQGRYLFSNDRVTQFGAPSGNTLIGRKLKDLYPPELAGYYQKKVDLVFETGSVISFEHELTEADGQHFHIDTLFPVYKEERITAVGGICRDITDRKKYEKELKKKSAALEEILEKLRKDQHLLADQERQHALSRMASGIAHNFNNALSTIQGFSDLLLQAPEQLAEPDRVKRYITLINTAARDAAQIVRRLRKFYRPRDEETTVWIDIKALIEEVLDLTEPVWKHSAQARGAAIRVEKDLEQSIINGNPAELQEVIINLVFNAVDAMPEGGTLTFRTRKEGDWVTLEIADTGIGMDTIVRKRCLDPFFTTKGESGSGLGLATVQGIIARHNGQIDIKSAPRQGTRFFIRLPVSAPGNRHEENIESKDAPLLDGRAFLKILAVDDEKNQRVLLKQFLQKDNHRVELAANGLEGIQKFYNGWFDLVITNRAMPELNGDALARNVKRIAPSKPVIMVTGFADMMNATGETPEFVDLVISKPISQDKLRQAITRVIPQNEQKQKTPRTGGPQREHPQNP